MTSKATPSIIQMEEENLRLLITEVKETIAIDINEQSTEFKNKKPACPVGRFGIADMWNSQRNVRTAVSRRRYHPKTF